MQAWDVQAEMLASSMMLVSIAEDQPTDTGYKTRTPSTGGLRRNSGGSLSRSLCQNNLALLSTGSADSNRMVASNSNIGYASSSAGSAEDSDEWGFFVDSR